LTIWVTWWVSYRDGNCLPVARSIANWPNLNFLLENVYKMEISANIHS
jgi:hypothetical protein